MEALGPPFGRHAALRLFHFCVGTECVDGQPYCPDYADSCDDEVVRETCPLTCNNCEGNGILISNQINRTKRTCGLPLPSEPKRPSNKDKNPYVLHPASS